MNGMVNWKNINSSPMSTYNRNQRLFDVLFGKRNTAKKGQRDSFIKGNNLIDDIGLYTAPVSKAKGVVNKNILDMRDYEPGAVFQVGGKEYVLSEDKKLNLPYGADVYDVKWPPRKKKQADSTV